MPIIGQISVGDGATFTPSVDNAGVLSWTNNKNLTNPATVDLAQAVLDKGLLAPIASPAFTGTPTAPTPTAGDDSTNIATTAFVQAELADYLALSGGTMTGQITLSGTNQAINNSATNDYVELNGGTTEETGAHLSLYGKDHATKPGYFTLETNDGVDSGRLVGQPNGTLQWGNSNVITSAGGTFTGNVNGVTPASNDDSTKLATTEWVVDSLKGNAFILNDSYTPTIPANSNLNNYTTPGTYRSTGSTVSATLSNCPVSNSAFKLFVIEIGYGSFGSYGMQIILGIGRAIYVRNKANTSWTAWGKLNYTDA